MLSVERVDPSSRAEVRRFRDLPFRLYADHANWVPPLNADMAEVFDRRRHPFYEHSDAEFFVATRLRGDPVPPGRTPPGGGDGDADAA
jgi:hypothetical protein